MKVGVYLNLNFLAIADNIITSKHICLVNFLNNEDRSGSWAWVGGSGCWNIGFINTKSSCAKISNQVSLNLFVCNQHLEPVPKIVVSASECPWNFLNGLINLGESLMKL